MNESKSRVSQVLGTSDPSSYLGRTGALAGYLGRSEIFPSTDDWNEQLLRLPSVRALYSQDLAIYMARLEMADPDGIVPGFDNAVRSLVLSIDQATSELEEGLKSLSATIPLGTRGATIPALVQELIAQRSKFPKAVLAEALITAAETEHAVFRPGLIHQFELALEHGEYTLREVSARALSSSRLNSPKSAPAIRAAAKKSTKLLGKTLDAVADDLETQ